MQKPTVSIIIPAYNAEAFIERSIGCALSQEGADVQAVVVDDGSTDGTAAAIEAIAARDSRVVFVKLPQNKGRLEARRAGIERADGDFILFLDADDEISLDAAATLLEAQEGRFDIVQCDFDIRYRHYASAEERAFNRAFNRPPNAAAEGDDITHLVFLKRRTTWSLCGKLMRASIVKEAVRHIGQSSISQAEDACIFFIISCLAHAYKGLPGYQGYIYNIDEGGSDARWKELDLEKFAYSCRYVNAMDAIGRFLDETGRAGTLAADYETVRHEHARAVADKLARSVKRELRPQATDVMLDMWPACEAIAGMAEACWDIPADCVDDTAGARSLSCSPRAIRTVGVYQYRMGIGGAERVVAELVRTWRSMGYRVVFFADEPRSAARQDLPDDLAWVELPAADSMQPDGYAQRARAIEAAVREHRIDVLVHNQWWNRLIAWDTLLFKALDVPVCLVCHSIYMLMFHEANPREFDHSRILRHLDGLVVLSEADKRFWQKFNPRVWRTNNPMTIEPREDRRAGLADKNIVWVGRLSDFDKQPAEAIEIMARVASQEPEATLTIVGASAQRQAIGKLKRLARKLGVESRIEFAAPDADVEQAYRTASVYLTTSRLEGWSLTLAESKACGLPCVMYGLGYLTLAEGSRGIIAVPQGDRDAAARAICSLLADEQQRRSLGQDAFEHARELAAYDLSAFWRDVFAALEAGSPVRDGFAHDDAEWDLLLEGFKDSLAKAFDAPVTSYAKRKGLKTARALYHRISIAASKHEDTGN